MPPPGSHRSAAVFTLLRLSHSHLCLGSGYSVVKVPTPFIYPLAWIARIAEKLKAKAPEMGVRGSHTFWWHMFGWNAFGLLLFEPAVAMYSFFDTLSKLEDVMNHGSDRIEGTYI